MSYKILRSLSYVAFRLFPAACAPRRPSNEACVPSISASISFQYLLRIELPFSHVTALSAVETYKIDVESIGGLLSTCL